MPVVVGGGGDSVTVQYGVWVSGVEARCTAHENTPRVSVKIHTQLAEIAAASSRETFRLIVRGEKIALTFRDQRRVSKCMCT